MPSTVYALLVGIDNYPAPVPPLKGCVADIEAMQSFLESRIGGDAHQIDVLVLKNEQATRKAVIEKFLSHLGQAGPDDTALFCFNGHGSQAPTAAEFLYLEPDGLDETLVCYDSRMPGHFDLADKEISKLIAEVAKKDTHVVLVLDSCHSGSATRSIESTGVRRLATDTRQRPVSSYFVSPSELQAFAKTRGVSESQSGWVSLPRGKHLVLSACESDEEAKEIEIDGRSRGVFSYYLMDTLQNASGTWSYRDLYSRVTSIVKAMVSRQSPVIEATDFSDLDRPFLGGAVQSHTAYFTASFDDRAGWVIDAGSIHGIPPVQQDDTTRLAIFPADASDRQATGQAIGSARVTKLQANRSAIEMTMNDGSSPDDMTIYRAIITSVPVPALGVSLEGDAEAIQRVRDLLAGTAGSAPNTQLREVESGAALHLSARDNCFTIKRSGDDRPLNAVIEGWSPENARDAVEYLEHIGRWIRMSRLNNATSELPPDAVSMDVYRVKNNGELETFGRPGQGSDRRLFYEYRDGEWHEPTIKIKLTNRSDRQLYCMLFDLTDSFGISSKGLLPGGGVLLEPGQETWVWEGEAIPTSMPDDLWQSGMTEYTDLLKLVVCTEKCDATGFEQGSLGIKYIPSATRSVSSFNSLEQHMQHSMTRGGSRATAKFVDWTTTEFGITTVRPLEGASVPASGETQSLSPQVKVKGHAGFKASIRLSTVPLATRDINGSPQLPTWLRDDPNQVQPFNLSTSRSAEAGLSVMELSDVSGAEAVTAEQPLTLQLGTKLAPNEHLLTIAYDPESKLYLPLGHATRVEQGVEVCIERLPAPTSGSRSLSGSIKIFFQKVISEKLGTSFEYPLLAATDAQGKLLTDRDAVAARVAESSRILLFVHGLIGDTRDMVKAAFSADDPLLQKPLGQHYDLVLSFDYENLNTEIEVNARALRERLAQVGLGANHGKTLHIVSHSMGGLVSRWFIEYLGGNKVVQQLVMLGTPNGGSPWPSVEDWVVAAIGVGMNGLTTIVWPVQALGKLMTVFEEAATVSLAQMGNDSLFLQSLAASPDPAVRYSVIAGNTSIIAAALKPQDGQGKSRIRSLFEKLNLQKVLHATTSLAFFGTPNDIAADVASINSVPDFQMLDASREVACDHLSYFTTEAGLRALYESLNLLTGAASKS